MLCLGNKQRSFCHFWGCIHYCILDSFVDYEFSSVQFSHSVVCDSLQPHGLQHARPPCPSPTLGVYSNSCLLSQRCHPTISPSVVRFSSCLQSFPASGSFPVSHLFASGSQSIETLASAPVLPMSTQGWFPLRLTLKGHCLNIAAICESPEYSLEGLMLKLKRQYFGH